MNEITIAASVMLCLLFTLPSVSAVTITVNITLAWPPANQPFTVSGQFVGYDGGVLWEVDLYDNEHCEVSLTTGIISFVKGYTSAGGGYSATFAGVPGGTYSVLVYDFFGDVSLCTIFSIGVATPPPQAAPGPPVGAPVGGVIVPANTLAIVAPWLAVIGLVGCIGTVAVVAKRRGP